MPSIAQPHKVLFRFVDDARRLSQWAQRDGSERQKEIAANVLKVLTHVSNTFMEDATPLEPLQAQRSQAYLVGARAAAMDKMNGTQSNPPYDPDTEQQENNDWIAGYHGD
jgi:hypothetical protein